MKKGYLRVVCPLALTVLLTAALPPPACVWAWEEGEQTWTDEEAGTETPPEMPDKKGFADVPEGAWFKESVAFVAERGLLYGTEEAYFYPYSPMTRGMLVTMLYRLAQMEPSRFGVACERPLRFTDVPQGQWYSDAAGWAGGTGLVQGVGDGRFCPNRLVTRQEWITVLYNYAGLTGAREEAAEPPPSGTVQSQNPAETPIAAPDTPAGDAPEGTFSGAAPWAEPALCWASEQRFVNGSSGELYPQAKVTRAEVAYLLTEFMVWCETGERQEQEME